MGIRKEREREDEDSPRSSDEEWLGSTCKLAVKECRNRKKRRKEEVDAASCDGNYVVVEIYRRL